MHVKMKGDALDDYIAEFQHLRALAGWGEDDAGTLMLFKQGLTPGLHKAILEKTPVQPTTLNGWAEAARKQHALWAEVKASLGGATYNKPAGTEGQRWRNVLGRNRDEKGRWDKTQWHGVRKEDRMEIDTAELNALSVEERNRLQKEGHCFNCRKTGHMSRACPTKQDASKKIASENQKSTIRTTKAEEEGSEKKKMAESIKAMTMEERNKLLDDLVLAGF